MKQIKLFEITIFILLITFITVFSHLNAQTVIPNEKRWETLMNLINQEIQTINGSQDSSPEMQHRLFELYSEKIKLIKEKENSIFLKADKQRVMEKGKDFFFHSSIEQYKMAQTYGLSILKNYPKYEKSNEIFYALAINSRDYGTGNETEKFLLLALKSGVASLKVTHNAKTALAEHYYNEKKYNEAIRYYEDVLKNVTDEWYAKHLYNASWCYIKDRNFKKALSLIKDSYTVASQRNNEGIKVQVLNAAGLFFVQADSVLDGVDFYTQYSPTPSIHLMSLAKSSRSKNDFILTDNVIKTALNFSLKEKNIDQEMKVRLEQLELYRENKKTDLFIQASSQIIEINKKRNIGEENIILISNKIKELAGFMQINLAKDKSQEVVQFKKEEYYKVIKLFDLLASLDKKNRHFYRYYQGETSFSVGEFKKANRFYVRSILISKKNKIIIPQTIKTIDSLLVSIDQAKLSPTADDRLTIFALKNYLIFYPKSDRSQKLYQKLFSKYYQIGQLKRATNIMLVYHSHYPADEIIHREMLTQLLDLYIKNKNTERLATWINIIDKGFLNFQNDFVQSSIAILGNLLFEKNQILEKENKLALALASYEEIYHSKLYPQKIKSEAAYAMSTVFLQENDSQNSLKWFKKSLEQYPTKDLIKTTGNIYNLAKGHRLLQNFENSSLISSIVLEKFCQEKFIKKNEFYELMISNLVLTNKTTSELLNEEKKLSKCDISELTKSKLQTDIFSMMILSNQTHNILQYAKDRDLNENSVKILKLFFHFKFWQVSTETIALFKPLKKESVLFGIDKLTFEYESLVAYREKVAGIKFIFSADEKFNDEKYNTELEQYLSIVNELTNEALKLAKNSSPEVAILLQDLMATPYQELQMAILKFRPKGVDQLYLKGFNTGMRQISESLSAKILQFDREKTSFFDKNHFFFDTKNHATFRTGKVNLEQTLDFHSAIKFSKVVEYSGMRK